MNRSKTIVIFIHLKTFNRRNRGKIVQRKCQKITKNVNVVYESSHNALKDFLKEHSYSYISYDIFPIIILCIILAMRHKYFLKCLKMKMLLQIGWLCLYDVIDGREKCFPLTQSTLLVQVFRQQKNQLLLIQRSSPSRDSQEPKTRKKIHFS